MIVNRYKILNKFSGDGSVGTNELTFSATTGVYKYVTLPINLTFNPAGNSESINNLVDIESFKAINPNFDGDKIKYKNTTGINIVFRFLNKQNNKYESDYNLIGFDITKDRTKNFFNKSFFRLYFYNDNNPTTRELLFFEDFDLVGSEKPEMLLKNIYYSTNTNNSNNTIVYMLARFFNAKTGVITDFIPLNPTISSPITISEYNSNSDLWASPFLIINPKNNNGNHNFRLVSGNTTLILSEQVIL
jgi:hypothetical protein